MMSEVAEEVVKFEFDESFQTLIAANALRNYEFMRRCSHLLKPDYFENMGEAALVNIALCHFDKYKTVPDTMVVGTLIKDDLDSGVIRRDFKSVVIQSCRELFSSKLTEEQLIEEKLVEFVRHQAVSSAILKSVELLGKKKFSEIEKAVSDALDIGANESGNEYDYFKCIEQRTEIRLDKVSGKVPSTGITTGNIKLDSLLYHRGWGRKELSLILGGLKSGKSMALIEFAKGAALAGHNVLFVTLEVASSIAAERLDANMSDNPINELSRTIHDTRIKVEALGKKSGKLKLHEFPSGSISPSKVRSLLDRYKRNGEQYDLVVVDYADLMRPDHLFDDSIENSRTVYVDLRGIASEFNCAVLTATQTNREGMKSAVAKAEHVASDINKMRTCDIAISINRNEEEMKSGDCRLYFAASRNQESGFTVFIKQDLSRAQFLKSVVRVE